MKKILSVLSVLLLVCMITTSCNKGGPKDVAETWLTGFYHMDYDAAKAVSTEKTKIFITSIQQFSSMVPDSNRKEMKKIAVKVKTVKVDGDKATATYTISDAPDKEQTLPLVKENGKWLVQFSKDDQSAATAADAAAADQPAAAGGTDTTGGATPSAPPTDTSGMH